MIDFEYVNPARIIFGEKPYERIAERLKQYHVKSLLMVYSGEFVKTLGIYQELHSFPTGTLFQIQKLNLSENSSKQEEKIKQISFSLLEEDHLLIQRKQLH